MPPDRSTLLITPEELQASLDQFVVAEVRWRLGQPEAGRELYEKARIPSARFVDLEAALSRAESGGGRHPLPLAEDFARTLCDHGIGKSDSVVVYDDMGGAVAARLWWMMRWIGAKPPRLLDGGFDAWQALGLSTETGPSTRRERCREPLVPQQNPNHLINGEDLLGQLGDWLVLDAREAARYRGDTEPVDPKAGHIPGARSAFFGSNLDKDNRFRPSEDLRAHYESLGVREATRVVCYCGSGVTACHDVFAMELAGLSGARLYPGSWSQWCELRGATVETGEG